MVYYRKSAIFGRFLSIFEDHREAMKNRSKMVDFLSREILDFWLKLVGIATIQVRIGGSILA